MRLMFYLGLLGLAFTTFAGTDVQKGGDAIACVKSSTNQFSGYYSLDYLAQYNPDLSAVPATSLDASLDRIQKNIEAKLPEMFDSFKDFRRNLFNEEDPSMDRLWEKAAFGLVDLQDEALVNKMPENCLTGGKASIVQAVVRQPPEMTGLPPGKYLYKYVPEVVDQLRETNPVQLSFLLIHEWLWDFSANVERNRRVNYLLHSMQLENWTRDQWLTNLAGLGFSIPTRQEPVFDPSICPADPKALEKLKGRLNQDADVNLGMGKAYARTRLCNQKTGCSQYIDTTNVFNANFSSYIKLDLIDGQLTVSSQESGSRPVIHFSCHFSGSLLKCQPFVLNSGELFFPALVFRAEVGSSCVRFTSEIINEPQARDSQVDDYVIYFSNIYL